MPKIRIETQVGFIREFAAVRSKYEEYTNILKEIIETAVNLYATMCVVQIRVKSVSSFAEKLLRKDKYTNPLKEITDLCGARIICHNAGQVEKICDFIKKNFEIDRQNSLDIKSLKNFSDQGYRSAHYIVKPRSPFILGVQIPETLMNLKAEIQVRTFSEHTWTDIFHDRISKLPVAIPGTWRHEAADSITGRSDSFRKLSETLDQLAISYLPTPKPETADKEKEILKTIIKIDPEVSDINTEYRLKLATLFVSCGDWHEVAAILKPVEENPEKLKDPVLKAMLKCELGNALCNVNKISPDSKAYQEGINLITGALSLLTRSKNPMEMAKAWNYLGKTIQPVKGVSRTEIMQCFETAHDLVPSNPYYFMNFLVSNRLFKDDSGKSGSDFLKPAICTYMEECGRHVELGVEATPALFTILKLALIMGDSELAMNTLMQVADFIMNDRVIFSKATVEEQLYDLGIITDETGECTDLITSMIYLLLFHKYDHPLPDKFLINFHHPVIKISPPVLIIAGDCLQPEQSLKGDYHQYIEKLLCDFKGTAISGGKDTGIPAMAGKIAEKLEKEGIKKFKLIGYLPEKLPDRKKHSTGYDGFVLSPGMKFSFHEVLNYWTDILINKINSSDVRFTGIGGGPIALLEYKMALAMGAKVELKEDSGGSAEVIFNDNYWGKHEKLTIIV